MVVDTSAIVAIILGEPERQTFLALLATERPLLLSAVTLHEASVVIAGNKRDRTAVRFVDGLIRQHVMEVVPLDIDGSIAAREAYFRFGRGWHAAGLNFADCFSYSLAKTRNDILLFKGDDFLKTDIVPAWRP
jgi:ribonuclease VapC